MTLSPGAKLGPYEILEQIGAGGMGEVYRAKDPRLGREVAIKVLPAFFDPDRLRRFEREAQAAGGLNHPNITAVHDIGTQDGAPYVVMELLRGQTLRERMLSGPIPVRKAIDYGIQIARGLAAAHEASIVHRDLKPENLFITADGRVKILDFGLAKLTQTDRDTLLSQGETVTQTEPGVVLGTLGYMSPEQVKGQSADARSDLFSLGAVLYEMLAGKRAFKGDSAAETMSAILKEEPPELSETNKTVAPGLERVVRRCLEKNPEERTHSAHDLAFQLETLSTISSTATAASPRRRFPWVPLGAALAGALAAGILTFFAARKGPTPPPPSFLQLTFRRGSILSARFAPDGETIVYTAAWDGKPIEIFVGNISNSDARPFGLTGAEALAISSRGELAVSTNRNASSGERTGTLTRVPIGGGVAPREVLDGVDWADWSPDGKTLAIVREGRLEFPSGKVLYTVSTDGWLSHMRVSPDGERVAFIEHIASGDDTGTIYVVGKNGSKLKSEKTFISAQGLAWTPAGEVWFTGTEPGGSSSGTNTRALYRMDQSGKTRLVIRVPGSLTLHDISRTGRLLVTRDAFRSETWALAPGESKERDLTWLDGSGGVYLAFDGKKVVFTGPPREFGTPPGPPGEPFNYYHVYLRATDGSPPVMLGQGQALGLSRDGKWAIAVPRFSQPEFVFYPTGAGEPRRMPLEGYTLFNTDGFIDDTHFLFTANEKGHELRVYLSDINGTKPRPITPEGFHARNRVTGDGKWFFAGGPNEKFFLCPTNGGDPKEITNLPAGDRITGLGEDDSYCFVRKGRDLPAQIYRHDFRTGKQEKSREITPADTAGIGSLGIVTAPRGDSYVYMCDRWLSDLYLTDPVR